MSWEWVTVQKEISKASECEKSEISQKNWWWEKTSKAFEVRDPQQEIELHSGMEGKEWLAGNGRKFVLSKVQPGFIHLEMAPVVYKCTGRPDWDKMVNLHTVKATNCAPDHYYMWKLNLFGEDLILLGPGHTTACNGFATTWRWEIGHCMMHGECFPSFAGCFLVCLRLE